MEKQELKILLKNYGDKVIEKLQDLCSKIGIPGLQDVTNIESETTHDITARNYIASELKNSSGNSKILTTDSTGKLKLIDTPEGGGDGNGGGSDPEPGIECKPNLVTFEENASKITVDAGIFSNNNQFSTIILEVEEGKPYSISRENKESNRFRVYFSKEYPEAGDPYIKPDELGNNEHYEMDDEALEYENIIVPEGYHYLILYFHTRSSSSEQYYNDSNIKIEQNEVATPYDCVPGENGDDLELPEKITKEEIINKSTGKRLAEGKAIHEAIEDITENIYAGHLVDDENFELTNGGAAAKSDTALYIDVQEEKLYYFDSGSGKFVAVLGYELHPATHDKLGGFKVGKGLYMDSENRLNSEENIAFDLSEVSYDKNEYDGETEWKDLDLHTLPAGLYAVNVDKNGIGDPDYDIKNGITLASEVMLDHSKAVLVFYDIKYSRSHPGGILDKQVIEATLRMGDGDSTPRRWIKTNRADTFSKWVELTNTLPVHIYNNLPSNPIIGQQAIVVDAKNPVWNEPVENGGASSVNVFWNGTDWICG